MFLTSQEHVFLYVTDSDDKIGSKPDKHIRKGSCCILTKMTKLINNGYQAINHYPTQSWSTSMMTFTKANVSCPDL